MIRHIVLFRIRDEYKDEIPQLVENFYGMKGKIEGMLIGGYEDRHGDFSLHKGLLFIRCAALFSK